MRKSLGNKRQELGDDHIAEITRLFGELKEGKLSKIFDNEDFGYRRITVGRPLRLNFQASSERIELLKDEKAFQGLAASDKKGKGDAVACDHRIPSPDLSRGERNPAREA